MNPEDAQRYKAMALLRLKDGLNPVEIYGQIKPKDENMAYEVYIAAVDETGDPKAKVSRERRRELEKIFKQL
jgi:hypothetical protein